MPTPRVTRTRHRPRTAGVAGHEVSRAARARQALQDHALVERLARTFRALGDPTRSKMVYALSLGELCVSELA